MSAAPRIASFAAATRLDARTHFSRSLCRLYCSPRKHLSTCIASTPRRNTQRLAETSKSRIQARRWQSSEPKDKPSSSTDKPGPNTALADALKASHQSDLLSEVRIPPDPDGVLQPDHPAMAVLGHSSLVIQRQIEWQSIIAHIEVANRYVILDGQGNTIGYLIEQDHGVGGKLARQATRTHRSFTAHVLDKDQREVLRIHRPFTYVSSRIKVYDPIPPEGYGPRTNVSSTEVDGPTAQLSPLKLVDMRVVGESQQVWSATARNYNLFTVRPGAIDTTSSTSDLVSALGPEEANEALAASMTQFALISEPMLSWDFTAKTDKGQVLSTVSRSFRGLANEAFTDTGVYVLRMDAAASAHSGESTQQTSAGLTLDQRAVMINTAISIDFDYFSRHSSNLGFVPLFWPIGGGGAAAEGGAAGAGAGVGAIEGAGAGVAGAAGRGVAGAGGAVESGIAGAGTMAGYEAMQRGFGRDGTVDDASPTNPETYDTLDPSTRGQGGQSDGQEDVWGDGADPWKEQDASTGDGVDPGEGGILSTLWDWLS